jgi:hypothetical protein
MSEKITTKTQLIILIIAALCGLAIIIPSFISGFRIGDPEYTAIVSLDGSPSLHYHLDYDGNVIVVHANNEKAVVLLEDLKVKGLPVDQAISVTIARVYAMEMIDENMPVILVTGAINDKVAMVQKDYKLYEQLFISQLQEIDAKQSKLLVWLSTYRNLLNKAEYDRLTVGRETIKIWSEELDIDISSNELHYNKINDLLTKLNLVQDNSQVMIIK